MSDDPLGQTSRLPCFNRDLKRLKKRFRSIDDDLEAFINTAVKLFHSPDYVTKDHLGITQVPGLGFKHPKVYKALKFACKSLKGTGARSGIRVIYAYFEKERRVELVEIYYKGDKENEDRDRILRELKGA